MKIKRVETQVKNFYLKKVDPLKCKSENVHPKKKIESEILTCIFTFNRADLSSPESNNKKKIEVQVL